MSTETLFFILFLIGIFGILIFDLGVLSPHHHVVSFKEALGWTLVWFTLAIGFYVFLTYYGHLIHGISNLDDLHLVNEKYKHKMVFEGLEFHEALRSYNRIISIEYLTGFFIEYSLSADNLFVIMMIFQSFGVSRKHYKLVLMWGIIGAVIMRFTFIFIGASIIHEFHFVLKIFGAFLIYSGIKMFTTKDKESSAIRPENHPLVKFVSRFLHIYPRNIKSVFAFRHKKDNKRYFTPLFVVLLVVEFSDLIFAVDSVPAIFAITLDPYIVFFSNIFAILGLRSLFFLLERVINLFHLLGYGLALLLVFIGFKLIFESWFKEMGFTNETSLLVILGILGTSIAASLIFPARKKDLKE